MASGSKSLELKTRVGIDGEQTYKSALTSIASSLRVMKAEMNATQSAFAGNSESIEALTAKQQALQEQQEKHAEKVRLLKEMLELAKAEFGENSTEADEYRIKVANAETALNKCTNELNSTTEALNGMGTSADEASEDTGDLDTALGDLGESAATAGTNTSTFGEKLGGVAEIIGRGLAAGAQAVAEAFVAVGTAAAQAISGGFELSRGAGTFADDLLTLSTQTGISSQRLQEWAYSSNFIDTSVETMTGSMTRMVRNMGNAASGSESAQAAFDALGVSITDNNGNLRSSEDVFMDCVDALGAIENPTERDAAAMEIFGKSARELNPLIEAGSEGLQAMGQEAHDMGVVFSDEAVQAMGSFDDSMQRLNATGAAVQTAIGASLIPAFQPLVDTATEAMAGVANALNDGFQPEDIQVIGETIATALTEGIGTITTLMEQLGPLLTESVSALVNVVVEQLPGMVETVLPAALSLLQGVVDSVTANIEPLAAMAASVVTALGGFLAENAPELVSAAVSLVTGLVNGISEQLPTLLPAAASMIAQIVVGLAEALPDIVASGSDLLVNLTSGLTAAIPQLIEALPAIVEAILGAITEALPQILESGASILTELISGITGAIPSLVEALPQIVTTIIETLATNLPQVLTSGVEVIVQLVSGLVEAIPKIVEAMPQIISAIVTALSEIDWIELGTNLIQGLVDGLTSAVSSLLEAIKGVFVTIWEAIKGVFGIHSPSTEAASAGKLILDGLVKGFSDAVDAVCETVKAIFGKIWDAIKSIFGFGGKSEESKDAEQAGKDIMSGIKSGVTGSENDVKEAVKNSAKAVLDMLKGELGVNNGNSTKTKPMGEGVAKGIVDGLNAVEASAFQSGANAIFSAVIQAINTAFGVSGTGVLGLGGSSAAKFSDIGAAISKAVADGINSNNQNTEAVKQAITGVANAAFEAAVTEMSTGITGSTETVNAAVQAVAQAAHDAAQEILSQSAGETVGGDYTGGIEAGVQNAQSSLTTQIRATANAALQTLRGIINDSAGRTIGSALGQGLASGMSGRSGSVSSTAGNLGRAALSGLWSTVGTGGSAFAAIGEAIASGVARGIDSGADRITRAAQTAALNAYNASRRILDIRSPSHVMQEVGEQFDAGFAQGIENGMRGVIDSAQSLSRMAAGSVQSVRTSAPLIDYDSLGQATAKALKNAGVGKTALFVGKRELSESIEPEMSQAMRARSGQSVAGRASRMVIA